MWLIDELAERHIALALQQGQFDNLPGCGQPLSLDDDSGVPPELRVAYRLLKNAGCLPLELEERKEALQLSDLLENISRQSPEYEALSRRFRLLELRLQQRGVNTDFLHADYSASLKQAFDSR
ncbi:MULTISPECIES: DnaJ family domain-containing protein [Brenneria]|uniref:DUF1992 domain-containing protein n=1 Tax=Brenneria nigrifluens DSM 30175 = ATCC 13028 TaxID=1121120 RepID=A0A2U1UTW2_9GAMM|nr:MULTISPECIES: DnaJ family domain-containing protein [Brenneria]EHD19912.1 DnaJ-like, subfamily C, domain-containing protein [Brenneria sp. EniD312]PWC25088.1 hypothetical protein DDT54_05985 [Brenneria nigrifluens DSM 30175 = ATCC 13028]QCR03161.1 DUF1992 domain-containing protein [Brenneria nigrifluens DSM 30175 = ATCC 13028]